MSKLTREVPILPKRKPEMNKSFVPGIANLIKGFLLHGNDTNLYHLQEQLTEFGKGRSSLQNRSGKMLCYCERNLPIKLDRFGVV